MSGIPSMLANPIKSVGYCYTKKSWKPQNNAQTAKKPSPFQILVWTNHQKMACRTSANHARTKEIKEIMLKIMLKIENTYTRNHHKKNILNSAIKGW